MHEDKRPKAEIDNRDPFAFTVHELLNRCMQAAVRTCHFYQVYGDDKRFRPPSTTAAPDIDRRKTRTIVVAVDNVNDHQWKVAAAIAAFAGVRPSLVKTLEFDEVPFQDFLAHGSTGYTQAIDRGEHITYVQIGAMLDWRRVFQTEGYKSLAHRRHWMASVASTEELFIAKIEYDLGLLRQGVRKGMLNYSTIRNDSGMNGTVPNEWYLLNKTQKTQQGFAGTVKWYPSQCHIEFPHP